MLGLCQLCPMSQYYKCYWKTCGWSMHLCLSHDGANSGMLSPRCKFITRTLTNTLFWQHSKCFSVSVQRQNRQASTDAKLRSVPLKILKITELEGAACSTWSSCQWTFFFFARHLLCKMCMFKAKRSHPVLFS